MFAPRSEKLSAGPRTNAFKIDRAVVVAGDGARRVIDADGWGIGFAARVLHVDKQARRREIAPRRESVFDGPGDAGRKKNLRVPVSLPPRRPLARGLGQYFL